MPALRLGTIIDNIEAPPRLVLVQELRISYLQNIEKEDIVVLSTAPLNLFCYLADSSTY
jgi:hypothetical protein